MVGDGWLSGGRLLGVGFIAIKNPSNCDWSAERRDIAGAMINVKSVRGWSL